MPMVRRSPLGMPRALLRLPTAQLPLDRPYLPPTTYLVGLVGVTGYVEGRRSLPEPTTAAGTGHRLMMGAAGTTGGGGLRSVIGQLTGAHTYIHAPQRWMYRWMPRQHRQASQHGDQPERPTVLSGTQAYLGSIRVACFGSSCSTRQQAGRQAQTSSSSSLSLWTAALSRWLAGWLASWLVRATHGVSCRLGLAAALALPFLLYGGGLGLVLGPDDELGPRLAQQELVQAHLQPLNHTTHHKEAQSNPIPPPAAHPPPRRLRPRAPAAWGLGLAAPRAAAPSSLTSSGSVVG